MKLLVALLGPALLAVVFMESATYVANRSSERPSAQRLEWGGRIFTSEAAFERWLVARGRSYERWRERHPDSPWRTRAANGSSRSSRPPWLATAAAGLAAAASVVIAFLLARRAVGAAVVRVFRRRSAIARAWPSVGPHVRRGARVVRAALEAGGALAWRAMRKAGQSSRPVVQRVRRSLLAVRAAAPTETRRLGSLLRLRAHDLAAQAQVARHTPEARSAIALGAGMVASGALGIGIVFLLQ